MSEAVLFEELAAANGKVGRITLNVEGTLNSLTLEMVDLLQVKLDAWADDDAIAAVFIEGAGEKAFCAGGDVQALYRSAIQNPGASCELAEAFFEREYRMNYTLHTYAKPILCWGHGIVMGGGLGVMAGCSHRVVTERTRIAMPEITIGLFPDVGGSWFLNHTPGQTGEFLALTGASVNAADAIYIGIADRFILSEHKEAVVNCLLRKEWSTDVEYNHALVRRVLRPFAEQSLAASPAGQVEPHAATIAQLLDGDDIHAVIDQIIGLETDDPWLAKARDSLAHGSPLAALWIDRQLVETRHMGLADVFRAELQLATNIVRHPEFAEGVRALLIDKDKTPAWQYRASRDVPADVLDGFFQSPWPRNPLQDLGR